MSKPIVTKWTFFETGTFEDQGSRSYRAKNFDDSVVDKILRTTDGGRTISASTISGVVSDILELDSNANTDIYIPNGWNEQRLAFILELLLDEGTENERRQVLTGYTDKSDLSHNNLLDPETQLFINNSFILNTFTLADHRGRRKSRRVMANDFIIRSAREDGGGSRRSRRGRDDEVEVLLRSEDIFYKRDSAGMSSNSGRNVRDGRIQLTGEVKLGRRADTNASDYLSSILRLGVGSEMRRRADDYHFAEIDTDAAPSFQRQSVDELASGYTRAGSLDDHGIFRDWLMDTDFANCGMIELRDLEDAVNMDCEPDVIIPGRTTRKYERHHRGDFENWGGSGRQDIIPDIVKNTLTSLLLRYTISEAQILITNQTELGEVICNISGERSLVDGFDLEPMLDSLEDQIAFDLGKIITRNGHEEITVQVDFNMLSSMIIEVDHHDGAGPVKYNAAIFADGLQTNLRADTESILDDLVNDTDDLINEIVDNVNK